MSDEVLREPGVERCEHADVCEHACRMWCMSYRPIVDREALAKLADEIDSMERVAFHNEVRVSDEVLVSITRRIREALGEAE